MILFFMMVYIGLAVLFVFGVGKITKREFFWWLAVAFSILLPTWDVVLGYLVYFPACLFMPKTAIYETAETDGIYYEGDYKNYIFDLSDATTRVGLDNLDLEKGYKFIESLITRKENIYNRDYIKISPVVYRCIPLPRRPENPTYLPIQCVSVSNVQSNYLVKVKTLKIGVTEITSKLIYDRKNKKLMAKQNMVNFGGFFWPFFNWMHWGWGQEGGGMSCPDVKLYNEFEFEVLKPKNIEEVKK